MRYRVRVGDEDIDLEVRRSGDATEVAVGGRVVAADLVRIARSPVYSLLLDGRSYEVSVHRRNGRFDLVIGGESYEAHVMDERAMRIAEATGDTGAQQSGETVLAPMPGVVIGVSVAPGDTVAPGQGVVTLEAMKMENELKSAVGGVVREVRVEVGRGVAQGEPLVVIE